MSFGRRVVVVFMRLSTLTVDFRLSATKQRSERTEFTTSPLPRSDDAVRHSMLYVHCTLQVVHLA